MARKIKLSPDQQALVGQRDDERKRFEQRKAWFVMEMRRQETNRYQMALDEDYYDAIQWTPEEAAEIRARGQNPVVYNEIFPTINWLLGTESRMRRDFKVLARTNASKEAGNDAETKTKLLKYLDDVNREPFERSQSCDDSWKAGLGWIEVGVRADPTEEPIYTRSESWRNMLHDSISGSMKPDDWRYVFRFREVDLDIAQAYFPGKEKELERASSADNGSMFSTNGWINGWPISGMVGTANMPAKWIQYDASASLFNPRKRVLLIECWNFEPSKETSGQGAGTIERTRMKMRVAIMTEFDTILEAWSPYRHNRFPFIPVWAYRRKKDGMPYGPIRQVRGPQDDLNKRMSKSLFLLSVNQLRVEEDAINAEVMDEDQIRDELAAPDGIAVFAKGALSGNKVQVREHLDIAQGHLALADRDIGAIRSVGSVNEENRGLGSQATSRVAMDAKAERGSVGTSKLFDNLMLAHQLEGEIKISLIEQYYTDRKVFSVTGERYKLDYTTINDVDPATGAKVNDVTAFKAQFVIGEAPWRQHLAEAAFESAMNMLAQLAPVAPQVVTSIIDLVFEWSDLPNKQAILQRIRQATGMSDPDKGDTPEQIADRMRKQQEAQLQFAANMAMLQAKVKEAQAKGEKLDAEAMQKTLESLYLSAQAAQVLAMAPGITPVADALLKSAGFKDKGEPDAPDGAAQPVIPPQPSNPGGGGAEIPDPTLTAGSLAGHMAGSETPQADGVRQPQE